MHIFIMLLLLFLHSSLFSALLVCKSQIRKFGAIRKKTLIINSIEKSSSCSHKFQKFMVWPQQFQKTIYGSAIEIFWIIIPKDFSNLWSVSIFSKKLWWFIHVKYPMTNCAWKNKAIFYQISCWSHWYNSSITNHFMNCRGVVRTGAMGAMAPSDFYNMYFGTRRFYGKH